MFGNVNSQNSELPFSLQGNGFLPEITDTTLAIAVQAVASEVRALREALDRNHGIEAEAADYQRLEDLIQAADDLQSAYEIAARTVLSLPPYEASASDRRA